jgi:aspartyl protease family protein
VNNVDGPSIVWSIVALMMVGASLMARRIPMGQALRMALGWVAIFAGLFVVFSFRPEIKAVWARVTSDLAGTANQTSTGETIRITRGDDGHFHLRLNVNDTPVDFMIDSGATYTAINSETATAAGVTPNAAGFPVALDTANGQVLARRAKIDKLSMDGLLMKNHSVVVSDSFGNTNVLGMNFLDALRSWRVEGAIMTLQP